MTLLSDPSITFDIKLLASQKSSGQWMFSQGNPSIPERKFIESVFYKGIDITEFINNHCDSLFDKWEEEINE
jgi:hypothetical protein